LKQPHKNHRLSWLNNTNKEHFMRVLLSTLAIMAVIAPAYANDMNRDPEGSIKQSTIISNEPAQPVPTKAMKPAISQNASSVAKMEPAAGVVSPATKFNKNDADMYNDPEGTVLPSRTVE
jgi:hypothetical protein